MREDQRASKPSTRGFKEVVAVRHPERLKYLPYFFSFSHFLSSCYHGRNNLVAVITRARKEDSGVIDLSEKIKNKKRSFGQLQAWGGCLLSKESRPHHAWSPCCCCVLGLNVSHASNFHPGFTSYLSVLSPILFLPLPSFPLCFPSLSVCLCLSLSLLSLSVSLALFVSVFLCVKLLLTRLWIYST